MEVGSVVWFRKPEAERDARGSSALSRPRAKNVSNEEVWRPWEKRRVVKVDSDEDKTTYLVNSIFQVRGKESV